MNRRLPKFYGEKAGSFREFGTVSDYNLIRISAGLLELSSLISIEVIPGYVYVNQSPDKELVLGEFLYSLWGWWAEERCPLIYLNRKPKVSPNLFVPTRLHTT